MKGSTVYGVSVGASLALLSGPLSPPWGPVVWWGVSALQLGMASVISWRRMGMPFATASMVSGAVTSGMIALLAIQGHRFPFVPRSWWLPLGVGIGATLLCMLIESRLNRGKWTAWREHVRESSALDILLIRHFPNLRGTGGSGT